MIKPHKGVINGYVAHVSLCSFNDELEVSIVVPELNLAALAY